MSTQIQIHGPHVTLVAAGRNPGMSDLVEVAVTTHSAVPDYRITMHEATWQQVVDQLAALGIVARAEVSA